MAEPTDILFVLWTWVGPGNHVLDRGPYPPTGRSNSGGGRGSPL